MLTPTQELTTQWKIEHTELDRFVGQTRLWIKEVCDRGLPRFGELGDKLRVLRARLQNHFELEDALASAIASQSDSVEVEAFRRQGDRDHGQLTARLDDMIERLMAPVAPFESFQAAVDEADLLFDTLEQHEEQEFESVRCLMPRS